MDTLRMNGIRLSDPLAQVNQFCVNDSGEDPVYLHQLLSASCINIEFLTLRFTESEKHITCCIAPDRLSFFQQTAAARHIRCTPEMGTLSLYPHKSSLSSIGYILKVLGDEKLPFCRMASSGSMLTFLVSHGEQERIAATLARHIDLPDTHTPFRQRLDAESLLLLKQKYAPETTATYVESKIKTYGIITKPDLTLIQMTCTTDGLSECGRQIQALEALGLRFYYASAGLYENGRIWLFLAIDTTKQEMAESQNHLISSALSSEKTGAFKIHSSVGAINLQGPHFGDRYGIADKAFTPLLEASIPILLAGCVGASIFIILPRPLVQKAKTVLSEVFESP